MLGLELQLSLVRLINPKGEKIRFNHCHQNTFHTHQWKKQQPVKTNGSLIIENNLGSCINKQNVE